MNYNWLILYLLCIEELNLLEARFFFLPEKYDLRVGQGKL